MERRNLRVVLACLFVAASCLLVMAGTASAHVIPQGDIAEAANCKITSLPGLMRQGELNEAGNVGDIVEIECNPAVFPGGTEVELSDAQLYNRCNATTDGYGTIHWATLAGGVQTGPIAHGVLDGDGNLTVDLVAGPNCAVGGTVISANTVVGNGNTVVESFAAAFAVEPAKPTPEGIEIKPTSQVEDEYTSSASTLIQAEFNSTEAKVRVAAPELNARCEIGGSLFLRPDGELVWAKELAGGYDKVDPSGTEALATDNDGNAFVIAIGLGSCKPGKSYFQVDEEASPFNTEEAPFTILAPEPTAY
ncbi:MAG TPA: hypothetical protein VHT27_12150 [Solirubrobacteraceae bacterium]|jgi:hypothetical protein|nr:hypothetical protein [Solirubrobacteraceae bacterium]